MVCGTVRGIPWCDSGGAIFVDRDATLVLIDCRLTGHSAFHGGAIFAAQRAVVVVRDSVFDANARADAVSESEQALGGAIYVYRGATLNASATCRQEHAWFVLI